MMNSITTCLTTFVAKLNGQIHLSVFWGLACLAVSAEQFCLCVSRAESPHFDNGDPSRSTAE